MHQRSPQRPQIYCFSMACWGLRDARKDDSSLVRLFLGPAAPVWATSRSLVSAFVQKGADTRRTIGAPQVRECSRCWAWCARTSTSSMKHSSLTTCDGT